MPRVRSGVKVSRTQKAEKKAGITQVEQVYLDKRPHYCACCGREYEKLAGNFSHTNSPLYAGNGGYVTVCNDCRDGMYDNFVKTLGSDEAAIERICQIFDVPYNETFIPEKAEPRGQSRISLYMSSTYLAQNARDRTYTGTYRRVNAVKTKKEIPEGAIKLFGRQKYTPDDYADLMGYLQDVIECYGEPKDSQMLSNYATLASMEYQRIRAGKTSPKDLTDIVRQKVEMTKVLGLKPKAATRNEESIGIQIRDIEKYTPAEYYADKKKYRDFFGIGKYIERFILRPMRNMMTGSRDEDTEFSVSAEGEDDA